VTSGEVVIFIYGVQHEISERKNLNLS